MLLENITVRGKTLVRNNSSHDLTVMRDCTFADPKHGGSPYYPRNVPRKGVFVTPQPPYYD